FQDRIVEPSGRADCQRPHALALARGKACFTQAEQTTIEPHPTRDGVVVSRVEAGRYGKKSRRCWHQSVSVSRSCSAICWTECRRILCEAKAEANPDIHDGVPAPPECIIIPPKQCVHGSSDPLVAMVSRPRTSVAAQ